MGQVLHSSATTTDFGRRLKTLKGLKPYEFICECWTNDAKRFTVNPLGQMPD